MSKVCGSVVRPLAFFLRCIAYMLPLRKAASLKSPRHVYSSDLQPQIARCRFIFHTCSRRSKSNSSSLSPHAYHAHHCCSYSPPRRLRVFHPCSTPRRIPSRRLLKCSLRTRTGRTSGRLGWTGCVGAHNALSHASGNWMLPPGLALPPYGPLSRFDASWQEGETFSEGRRCVCPRVIRGCLLCAGSRTRSGRPLTRSLGKGSQTSPRGGSCRASRCGKCFASDESC